MYTKQYKNVEKIVYFLLHKEEVNYSTVLLHYHNGTVYMENMVMSY